MNEDKTELTTDLTVSDMKIMASIIDVCAQRGTFKIQEYSMVGNLHAKLTAVLATVTDSK